MLKLAVVGSLLTTLVAAALLVATIMFSEGTSFTQRGWRSRFFGGGGGYAPSDIEYENMPYNGKFTFNRVRFNPSRWGWGPYMWGLDLGWNHDYPRAEKHFMEMLRSLTTIEPNMGGGNIYSLDDPEIFKYPWAYICEVGYWTVNETEAKNLRNYLLKGGFLVVDDLRGYAINVFYEQIQKALPGAELVILDTTNPAFNNFFEITKSDILNQAYTYGMPVTYGIYEDNDPSKRLMVVINYNQDIGESWEWSDEEYVPIELSNNAYKLGINYVIYGMTH
ncbi:MAG: DUF4159 domain-containing protein [Acidobacteriota bacterium]